MLSRMCQGVTTGVSRPSVVRRHLAGVSGLEHIPAQGPFVLVSNHTSFADHFIYDVLLYAARGDRAAFLTKADSFTGMRRLWFDAMGAVPVDRSAPARELFDVTGRVLAAGQVLVVYPEGTRNPVAPLLEFKDGAFRFAERAGVPVVPAALWGAQDILPKGSRLPRRARATVAFGPALTSDPDLPRSARIKDLGRRAEEAVVSLLKEVHATDPFTRETAARATVSVADEILEQSMSGTDTVAVKVRRQQARTLIRLARVNDPVSVDAEVTEARLAGLRALESKVLPVKVLRVMRMRSRIQQVLHRAPDHLMALYLMGRWHLSAPRFLGGSRDEAVRHLARAEEVVAGADTRYAMAHAEALEAAGRRDEALAALGRVVAAPAPDLRARRRRERADSRLAALGATAPGATSDAHRAASETGTHQAVVETGTHRTVEETG
ncbi:lysophospholipid acyltransferase family protein [Streptomyces sp. NPDC026672]|uniref:lysophospholipid acyltransferase family protein n=1 Tax=unclassified Streptomyces TaxID=2593676 RepID=UPI0033CF32CA